MTKRKASLPPMSFVVTTDNGHSKTTWQVPNSNMALLWATLNMLCDRDGRPARDFPFTRDAAHYLCSRARAGLATSAKEITWPSYQDLVGALERLEECLFRAELTALAASRTGESDAATA